VNTRVVCPVCEHGSLLAELYSDEVRHNGRLLCVEGLERCRCDACGADPVLTDQIKRNQLRVCDARRRADGYFTGAEIKALRQRVGLSQAEAADLFGGGANAFSKYERGEVIQSLPMDRLMRCVSAFPMLLSLLRQSADPSGAKTDNAHAAPSGVSLNDPWYTSRTVRGKKVRVSERDVQSTVVRLPLKKTA